MYRSTNCRAFNTSISRHPDTGRRCLSPETMIPRVPGNGGCEKHVIVRIFTDALVQRRRVDEHGVHGKQRKERLEGAHERLAAFAEFETHAPILVENWWRDHEAERPRTPCR